MAFGLKIGLIEAESYKTVNSWRMHFNKSATKSCTATDFVIFTPVFKIEVRNWIVFCGSR